MDGRGPLLQDIDAGSLQGWRALLSHGYILHPLIATFVGRYEVEAAFAGDDGYRVLDGGGCD
ncbi:hypothetical protein HPP92_023308 [Vanilla planifolia]|uniref:Uncharacterized protein n=1 Tax=Vanilla planifolia TaxID=51239 RepID=A0A835UGL7_VANPL|nr:hypothetical protein HPP92_023308 [Vanilla planifolia]